MVRPAVPIVQGVKGSSQEVDTLSTKCSEKIRKEHATPRSWVSLIDAACFFFNSPFNAALVKLSTVTINFSTNQKRHFGNFRHAYRLTLESPDGKISSREQKGVTP